MNRQDIERMEAGEEMDKLIHQRVFGNCPYEAGPREDRKGTISNFCKLCGDPGGYHEVPRYSTKVKEAFLIVEKFHKTHWIQLAAHVDWFWHFDIMDKTKGEAYIGAGETVPLAICRAALLTAL